MASPRLLHWWWEDFGFSFDRVHTQQGITAVTVCEGQSGRIESYTGSGVQNTQQMQALDPTPSRLTCGMLCSSSQTTFTLLL